MHTPRFETIDSTFVGTFGVVLSASFRGGTEQYSAYHQLWAVRCRRPFDNYELIMIGRLKEDAIAGRQSKMGG
jgi:hypothetical protein